MSVQQISLSGRKIEVSNKEMTFLERIYVWTILKGLWTTLKHLFRRKVTIKYPEEVREMSPVARLQHMLMRDDQGRERCTACAQKQARRNRNPRRIEHPSPINVQEREQSLSFFICEPCLGIRQANSRAPVSNL